MRDQRAGSPQRRCTRRSWRLFTALLHSARFSLQRLFALKSRSFASSSFGCSDSKLRTQPTMPEILIVDAPTTPTHPRHRAGSPLSPSSRTSSPTSPRFRRAHHLPYESRAPLELLPGWPSVNTATIGDGSDSPSSTPGRLHQLGKSSPPPLPSSCRAAAAITAIECDAAVAFAANPTACPARLVASNAGGAGGDGVVEAWLRGVRVVAPPRRRRAARNSPCQSTSLQGDADSLLPAGSSSVQSAAAPPAAPLLPPCARRAPRRPLPVRRSRSRARS